MEQWSAAPELGPKGLTLPPEESALVTEGWGSHTACPPHRWSLSAPGPPSLHSDSCRDVTSTPHSPPLPLFSLHTCQCPLLSALRPHGVASSALGGTREQGALCLPKLPPVAISRHPSWLHKSRPKPSGNTEGQEHQHCPCGKWPVHPERLTRGPRF